MDHSFFSRITAAPGILFRLVDQEALLLNLNTELYIGLDIIGTRMWNALMEAPSIQAAYEALLQEYDVEPAQLREDIEAFVGKLVEQGLVQVGPAEFATSASK